MILGIADNMLPCFVTHMCLTDSIPSKSSQAAQAHVTRRFGAWSMISYSIRRRHTSSLNSSGTSKPLVPYESFKAHIEANDEKQMMINDLVRSYGLEISPSKKPGTICAVAALEYIYDKYGYHILDATLRLTLATWESENNSLSANFLKAIARIIAVFGDSLREDIFKEHVGRCSVKSIIRTAKERRPGILGYAEAMLVAYNNKNKYRLPIKKLYGSQRDEEIDDEETDDDTATI